MTMPIPPRLLAPDRRSMVASLGLGAGALAALLPRRAEAVSAPPALLFDQMTNAKNFQAKGDGVTDDFQKLQNALNKAAANGNYYVFLPPGNYGISQGLTVPLGVSLVGVSSASDTSGLDVTKITALAGFPVGQAMITFADRWSARFENLTLDGGGHATAGVTQSSCRNAVNRNIRVANITHDNAGLNRAWRVDATTITASCNLYERIVLDPFSLGPGVNGFIGAGTDAGAFTLNTFSACEFGGGSGACALTYARSCDNNWCFGCFFSVIGASPDGVIQLNINSELKQVNENYFIGGAAVVDVSGYGVACKYNESFNQFTNFYFPGEANAYLIGTQGKLFFRNCTIGDQVVPNVKNISPTAGPASFTWPNTFPYQVNVIWWGSATISAISVARNGGPNAFGPTIDQMLLNPGESITWTYTDAPTIVGWPQP